LDTKEIAARLAKGDRRTVAKAITLVENDGRGAAALLREIGPTLGRAFVIGVTGPPGTGKSSLVDRLTESFRKKGLKVGIIAIDPTSPLTGGALLGDRIRMVDHTMDDGVFIRSMASRGWAGGLSGAVTDVIQLLDAAGMDVIMVETVGIGQSDTDVVRVAHTVVVVLMPGLGDDVQASKAGLMEIGDVYIVNKADLPGADDVVVDLLAMVRDFKGRDPSVLKVSAARNEGFQPVLEVLERTRSRFLTPPPVKEGSARARRAEGRRSAAAEGGGGEREGEDIRLRSIRGMITELARRRVVLDLQERVDARVGLLAEEVVRHRLTVEEAADSLLLRHGSGRRKRSEGGRTRGMGKKKQRPTARAS
jgi:LAO/AO transport system kinase